MKAGRNTISGIGFDHPISSGRHETPFITVEDAAVKPLIEPSVRKNDSFPTGVLNAGRRPFSGSAVRSGNRVVFLSGPKSANVFNSTCAGSRFSMT